METEMENVNSVDTGAFNRALSVYNPALDFDVTEASRTFPPARIESTS